MGFRLSPQTWTVLDETSVWNISDGEGEHSHKN